jgi:Dolichyl-phosphate-mannose-protein mannosyltransferase
VTIAWNRWKARVFLAAVFVIFAAFFGATSWMQTGGRTDVPPPPGDTHDYDDIAFQLAHGKGFSIDYTNAEFRRPYEAANADGTYDELLARRHRMPTTYRPPLLPVAVAATYLIFGRNFLAWEMIDALLTALGLTVVCAIALRAFGSRVALLTAGVMFLSKSYVWQVARCVMLTETLAILFIALLAWSLIGLAQSARTSAAVAAGASAGLLILSRSIYVLWLPFLALLVMWLARRHRALALTAIFLTVAIALQLPWWIRNCRVLGAFMPLGTEGGVSLYAAYSDLALQHDHWWNPPRTVMQTAFVGELGKGCPGVDEKSLAQCETKGALLWIAHHPLKVPALAWMKVRATLLYIYEAGDYWPLFFAVLATPFVIWRRRSLVDMQATIILAALTALNFLAIALTWTVGWRFVVPVEPLISVGVALTLAAVVFGDRAIEREA